MDWSLAVLGVSWVLVGTFSQCTCTNETWSTRFQAEEYANAYCGPFPVPPVPKGPTLPLTPNFSKIKTRNLQQLQRQPETMKNWSDESDHGFVINLPMNQSCPWIFELIFEARFEDKNKLKSKVDQRIDENENAKITDSSYRNKTESANSNNAFNFRQMIETVVTNNPVVVAVEKYPHLARNSVFSKTHIFQHLAIVSGVYLCICITFHNACFALVQRLSIVVQNFASDAVFEVIVDIVILIVIIWATNATLF